MVTPLKRWGIRAVAALYILSCLSLKAGGPDITREFSIDYKIDPKAEGKNAGKTLRHTYKPDGTFSGESKGRYVFQMPTAFSASIIESVEIGPNKIAQRQITLAFTNGSNGGGGMYNLDEAFGDDSGFLQFSFQFLDASKNPLQAGPRMMSIPGPLEKTISNQEQSADEAIAKLDLPEAVRRRMGSFNKNKRYWAVKGRLPVPRRYLSVSSTTQGQPSQVNATKSDFEIVPVEGRWLHYWILYEYLNPRGDNKTPDAPEALSLFSGSGIYADWLKGQAEGDLYLDEGVERIRRSLDFSAEVQAPDEASLGGEHDTIIQLLMSRDLLARPILNDEQLSLLCAKLAEEENAKRPTSAVTFETDIVPSSSTHPEVSHRLKISGSGFYFVAIPAGTLMSNENRPKLAPFWLCATEVTRKQFEALGMRAEHKDLRQNISEAGISLLQRIEKSPPECAVLDVTWLEASEWCRRFTEQEKKAGRLPEGYIYALPSEAQWNYALQVTGRAFSQFRPFDGLIVAQSEPNAGGLFDMTGNASEISLDGPDPRKTHSGEAVGKIGETWTALGARDVTRASVTSSLMDVGFRVALRKPFTEENMRAASSNEASNSITPDSARSSPPAIVRQTVSQVPSVRPVEKPAPVVHAAETQTARATSAAPSQPAVNKPSSTPAPIQTTSTDRGNVSGNYATAPRASKNISGTIWNGASEGDRLVFGEAGEFEAVEQGRNISGSFRRSNETGEVILTTSDGVAVYIKSSDDTALVASPNSNAGEPILHTSQWKFALGLPSNNDGAAEFTKSTVSSPRAVKDTSGGSTRKGYFAGTVWKNSTAGDSLVFDSSGDFEATIQGRKQKGSYRRKGADEVVTTAGDRIVTYVRSADGVQLQEVSVILNGAEVPTSSTQWTLDTGAQ